MINPTDSDIGRKVIFTRRGDGTPEAGIITSFNERYVFVRYGNDIHSKATYRVDLEWEVAQGEFVMPYSTYNQVKQGLDKAIEKEKLKNHFYNAFNKKELARRIAESLTLIIQDNCAKCEVNTMKAILQTGENTTLVCENCMDEIMTLGAIAMEKQCEHCYCELKYQGCCKCNSIRDRMTNE